MGKQPNSQFTDPNNRQASIASRFSSEQGIEDLQKVLAALNERIAELETKGPQSYAMEVLRVNAMDLARQIDELRCLLRKFKQ